MTAWWRVGPSPSSRSGAERRLPGLLVACLAAQVLVALTVVAPWQNPDEPQHLLAVRLIVAHGPHFTVGARDVLGEQQIVASMARHGWWRHYGRPTPDPLPATFAAGPAEVVQDAFVAPGGSRLYYRAMAAVFRALGVQSVIPQMYTMRVISAGAALLTVFIVWVAARIWLDPLAAFVTSVVMVLHPQFVIVSTTASPDAVTSLAAAIAWWKALEILKGPPTFTALTILWAAAIAAFLTRRMALPVVIGATLVSLVVFGRSLFTEGMPPGVRRFAYVFTLLLIVAAAAWSWAPDDLDIRTMQWRSSTVADVLAAIQSIRFSPSLAAGNLAQRFDALPQFVLGLFESFWLAAGWLRYKASWLWYAGAAIPTIIAIAGVGVRVVQWRATPGVAAAFVAVALQFTAIVIYYLGIMESGPQGRYLFPVLPAIFFLLWTGWSTVLARFTRPPTAALCLVAIVAVLNATAWGLVVVPAFQ